MPGRRSAPTPRRDAERAHRRSASPGRRVKDGRRGRLAIAPEHRVPLACLIVFLIVWTILAIDPRYRDDWLLENGLTFIAVPAAVLTYRRFRFSDRAYVQGTLFLVLHTIGSHYTYSEVPFGDWLRDLLGLSRNHYDRIVHFSFGFLWLRPLEELIFRKESPRRPITIALLSMCVVVSLSVVYELIEWVVAATVDPNAGTAFLGTQGDEWDAQKDMALAGAGALLAGLVEIALSSRGRGAANPRAR